MPLYLPELLCPAGDEAALRAAIDCGANAVYLGYKAFGARASAVNFDDEALERAVRYAHLYHARVHVTVNTLVKPSELESVYQTLSAIQAAGADAVIVQDQGVAAMVRRDFPKLHLHASTQMALCNAEGALMAQKLGFDRVVLARECSLEDIRRVCKTGIETEVFAHGALCTAVSGRCLMSSMAGGRSGNRGRCAQPCRQEFRLGGENGPLISLRDLCTLDDLPAFCEAGVASLKIEGRLKSPEYVAVVTSVYRRALDQIAKGEFQPGDLREKEKLMQIFNRGGFTCGHAFGAEDQDMITPDRVSHEGLPIGQILSVRREFASMRVDRDLRNGDSLQLRGAKDEDMRYSGPDVSAGDTATLRLRPGLRAEAGTSVARLTDARQVEEARAHAPLPIPVTMFAHFSVGSPMQLSISDGETSITVYGDDVQAAQKRASTADDARRQLEKLGGTPFVCESAQVLADENVFLPVSALNALRRDAVDKLTDMRIDAFADPANHVPVDFQLARHICANISKETVAVIFSDVSLAEKLKKAGATLPVYAPKIFTADALSADLATLSDGCWLRLPPQMTQKTLDAVLPVIKANKDRLAGIWAESVSQLSLLPDFSMIAGEGVPATNKEAAAVIGRFCVSACALWPEWSFSDQKALPAMPRLMKMYGREVLMLLNHCPERVRLGLSANRADCRLCKSASAVCGRENAVMTDRRNYRFPLARTRFAEGCEIQVLGALPTDLRAHNDDRLTLNAGMLLHFTTESAEQQIALTRLFASLARGEQVPPPAEQTTSGHWLRGVE